MYSFDPLARKVTARLYRIDPGTYEVALRRDADGTAGETVFSSKIHLMRYDTITVDVPSHTPLILTVNRLTADKKGSVQPDLAVASYDCERSASTLNVRVSNIGGAASAPFSVSVYDATGKKLAEQKVKSLGAPVDYVDRTAVAAFTGLPAAGPLRISVDDGNRIVEMLENNNTISIP